MIRVTDYQQVAEALDPLLRVGGLANGLPKREELAPELAAGTLRMETLPEGLLLLRQRESFQRLTFFLTEPEALVRWQPDRDTAVELVLRPRDAAMAALGEVLQDRGWALLVRRCRMSRQPGPLTEAQAALLAPPEAYDWSPDPAAFLRLLEPFYSPVYGCLPTVEQLALEGRLLLPSAGLHYCRHGNLTEFRHLVVQPEARGRGLAKALFAGALTQEGGKRTRLWFAAEDAGLRRLYSCFDFAPDGWYSLVLYRRSGD